MNHLPLIIKREYFTKVRNKSFIIMTFLSPLIFVALISVVAYLTQLNNNKKRTISILDNSGLFSQVFKTTENTTYNYIDGQNLDEAKVFVKDKNHYGLLYIGNGSLDEVSSSVNFYSEDSPSLTIISSLENKIERKLRELKLISNGFDPDQIEQSRMQVSIAQESFDGEKSSNIDNIFKLAFGGAAGYLLFMFIIIYGNMIMRSIIEEKTSRIIEVIISSVKPIQLMMGKIIGTSLAGVTQFIIWALLFGILIVTVSFILEIDLSAIQNQQTEAFQKILEQPDIQRDVQKGFQSFLKLPLLNLIIAFLFFFVCGYLLYSSLYAAVGAAVDNETDTQQFMLPILMPLILAVYVGVFTVIDDPHGTVSTVFSFIPFTSPVVMLMRIPFGVPIWQQLLSLLILIGTFTFTVWFAAKIYRVGILMYGKKPSYKELLKWMKY